MNYHCNRSHFLEQILKNKGWIKAKDDEEALFSHWFPYKYATKAIIQTFPMRFTRLMERKDKFYTVILESDPSLLKYLPKTYLSWEDAKDEPDNTIWFLKHVDSCESLNVYCYTNKKDLEKFANKDFIPGNYIIQKEVPNPLTILGRKVTFRVYAVMVNRETYLYTQVLGKLHPKRYNPTSNNKAIHSECSNSETTIRFVANHEMPNFTHKTWDSIYKVTKDIFNNVFWPKLHGFNNSYGIFGLDFIVDVNQQAFLIEINTYPSLWDKEAFGAQFKKQLLFDWYRFMIEPNIRWSGSIRLNRSSYFQLL
jgi:hypothetical protein